MFLFVSQIIYANGDSFFNFSPAPTTINNIKYPRNENIHYRGTTEQQLSLTDTIDSFFQNPDISIETKFFSEIKAKLMGKASPFRISLGSYISSEIDKEIKANQGYLNNSQAVQKAKTISDKTFDYLSKNFNEISKYFDYRHGSYSDWPDNVVFSTIIPPVAATYGDRIIVFKDQPIQSLDVNYWNYIKNNTKFDHTRDVGEFITFGYVPGNKLIGYEIRYGSSKAWHQIQYAIYKSFSTKKYALILSGQMDSGYQSSCFLVLEKTENRVAHCSFRPGQIVLDIPQALSEKVKILGLIQTCNVNGKDCAEPELNELSKYTKANLPSSIEATIQESLNTLNKKNNNLKFKIYKFNQDK